MTVHSKRLVLFPFYVHLLDLCTLYAILMIYLCPPIARTAHSELTPVHVLNLTASHCVVAISNNAEQIIEDGNGAEPPTLLAIADVAFRNEPRVFVGVSDLHNFVWPSGRQLNLDRKGSKPKAVVFPLTLEDRTCLQKPDYYTVNPQSFGFFGPKFDDAFVDFVNSHCSTFRRPDGELNHRGLHRQYLMENLFSVKDIPNSKTISHILSHQKSVVKEEFCFTEDRQYQDTCKGRRPKTNSSVFSDVPQCERIPLPDKEDFFNNYLSRSKPVIITGAMDSWPAISKWTNEFFHEKFGDEEVHIKLTPRGEYEGVEPADLWDNFKTFKIPPDVLAKLLYPDLVVVRPSTLDMKFSDFLNFMGNISDGVFTNVSAYLEYTSIADHFPELREDLVEMPFFTNMLKLAHLNIWLSDGNTLGKAHFDPFDNFLCQISGEKEVTLFEPHNEFLYEAHIPEAILSYNATLKQFRRSTLLDSTSMVMTPVDILKPHLERFPKFGSARPISCTIKEGEVLFMPAFWWHEVQSRPSLSQHRNLAVNFWYEPFFKKEFPCPECRLDVNPQYHHLL